MLAGRKVLLTGLTGRIGAAIAERFAGSCELWGLARYTREGSLEQAKGLGVIPVRGDYASGELAELPTDFDYVLHVAADVAPKSAEAGMAANSDGAAWLMKHCRAAKAFLHVSATGIYKQNPDPNFAYAETAELGGFYGGQYAPTKLAGEGAARAAAIILELPTVICRQNVQYGGPHVNGGLIDRYLDVFVETGEAFLPPEGPLIIGPIHEDDICDLVEPSLRLAAVPAEVVNWGGDELVDWQEMFEYAGALLGKAPRFTRKPEFAFPNCFPDTAKRLRIAGPCKVTWREGVRRSLQIRHPGIRLNEAA
jgi:nucleoside-diphosphate-sugar epimerase